LGGDFICSLLDMDKHKTQKTRMFSIAAPASDPNNTNGNGYGPASNFIDPTKWKVSNTKNNKTPGNGLNPCTL